MTCTNPVRCPCAVGVKVTLTLQEALARMEAPQVLVWAKSPIAVAEQTVTAAAPLFVIVEERAEPVEPTSCAGNVMLKGFRMRDELCPSS